MCIDNKCLEIWKAYGDGVKTLVLHRDQCVIDLHPFFEQIFVNRDHYLGKPKDYPRFKEKGRIVEYNFTFKEFIGAFLSRYHPDEFADFMKLHLIDDTMQSESLVSQIRDTFRNFDVFFVYGSELYSICSDRWDNSHINSFIPKKYRSRSPWGNEADAKISSPNHPQLGVLSASYHFRYKRLPRILENISKEHPSMAVSPLDGRGPALFADKKRKRPDYIGFMFHYQLPTENYALVKIK